MGKCFQKWKEKKLIKRFLHPAKCYENILEKKITLNIQDFNIKVIFENTPEEYT